nr:hypothetical protein CFP56_64462 [Quercus suber]
MVGEKQQYRPKETMAVAPKQYRNQVVDVPVGQLGTAAGSDLRESRWSGKGLIVEVAENGKRRVSWDNSKGGKSSFKWVIQASTEQKEEVGSNLGPKHSEAHCVSNSSPMSTSPCHFEAGECSNSFSGPIYSTSYPDGLEENPTVSPHGLMAPVRMSMSEKGGSFSVSQLYVGSPATAMQTSSGGGLLAQPECASPVGESGCIENLQHLVFRHSFDRNSFLGSNRPSGGLVF